MTDTERWLEKYASHFIKKIGIQEKDTVLDFGCGPGYYTIPAAKRAGKGTVYALDKNKERLNTVRERAESENLSNIKIIHTSGGTEIPLDDALVDVVLLYDVLHSHHFSSSERRKLLEEVERAAKPHALISVYPHHMKTERAYKELVDANFLFEKKIVTTVLHNRTLVEDTVLNFRKP
ncbi:MAG: class I SAM-dependent methyltransferase [Euryarchaeota archaeon]|nr:class I SAM-dependent methyltransferase [Euryarchaeota archaeon]